LGLLTCKNRLPYNLYCVGGDVKHCSINQSIFCLFLLQTYSLPSKTILNSHNLIFKISSTDLFSRKLHTADRRRSSTSLVRQSLEVDRSAVSTGQVMVVGVLLLWAHRPGIRCQTVFVTQLWVSAFTGIIWKLTFFAKYWRDVFCALEIF